MIELVSQGVSVKSACQVVGLSRSTFYREPTDWRARDAAVIAAIQLMLQKSPKAGFWKIVKRLKLKGYPFNHKRVYRVYCRLGLNMPRRIKRTLPKRPLVPLSVESKVNHQWALDFMHDTLYCGKRFRVLNIIDESTRECLAIEVDTSLPAQRLVRVMEQLKTERGLPNQVRVDNGPNSFPAHLLTGARSMVSRWSIYRKVSHSKTDLQNASTAPSAMSSWMLICLSP